MSSTLNFTVLYCIHRSKNRFIYLGAFRWLENIGLWNDFVRFFYHNLWSISQRCTTLHTERLLSVFSVEHCIQMRLLLEMDRTGHDCIVNGQKVTAKWLFDFWRWKFYPTALAHCLLWKKETTPPCVTQQQQQQKCHVVNLAATAVIVDLYSRLGRSAHNSVHLNSRSTNNSNGSTVSHEHFF